MTSQSQVEKLPLVASENGHELEEMGTSSAQHTGNVSPGGGSFKGYSPFHKYLCNSLGALWNYNAKLNTLLVFVPITFVANFMGAPDGYIFFSSLLGLIPLAALLGCTTEALASYTNQTLGGLLNATFGNATEVIISVIALMNAGPQNSMLRIVQLSLVGSILSNLLLVLGCAFLIGGVRYMNHPDETKRKSVQTFNKTAAQINCAMLLLAMTTLIFPDVLDETHEIQPCEMLTLSRVVSIGMMLMYGGFLWFQLKTHSHLFEDEDDDEEEDEDLGLGGCITYMGILTVLISILSEFLVATIETTSEDWHVPKLFIAVILIPIVGNAAEHATAVVMAYKDKMEITMGVAVGSSVQVAVFVIPFMVIMGWVLDKPLSLDMHPFETATVFLSVLLVQFMVADGQSNYLHGAMLLFIYILISLGFIYHDSEDAHCITTELCGWPQQACAGIGSAAH